MKCGNSILAEGVSGCAVLLEGESFSVFVLPDHGEEPRVEADSPRVVEARAATLPPVEPESSSANGPTDSAEDPKNPEPTVCQLHTAMAALVRLWGLPFPTARGEVLQKAAAKIRYTQHRKAQARKSHWRQALERLRQFGITLFELKRCTWDTT
jgi:hypothetical protein